MQQPQPTTVLETEWNLPPYVTLPSFLETAWHIILGQRGEYFLCINALHFCFHPSIQCQSWFKIPSICKLTTPSFMLWKEICILTVAVITPWLGVFFGYILHLYNFVYCVIYLAIEYFYVSGVLGGTALMHWESIKVKYFDHPRFALNLIYLFFIYSF